MCVIFLRNEAEEILFEFLKCKFEKVNGIDLIFVFTGCTDMVKKKRRLKFTCAYALTISSKFFDSVRGFRSANLNESVGAFIA